LLFKTNLGQPTQADESMDQQSRIAFLESYVDKVAVSQLPMDATMQDEGKVGERVLPTPSPLGSPSHPARHSSSPSANEGDGSTINLPDAVNPPSVGSSESTL
jgi:hypothetical protein